MRVDQFVPSFVRHDAISNHVLQIQRVLRQAGYSSDVYYQEADHRVAGQGRSYLECDARPDPDRLIVYHASTDSPMATWLASASASGQRVASDYHNITPSRYFARWEPPAARSMDLARKELALLAGRVRFAFADSAYNERELVELGYRHTSVCPLLVDLEEFHREPDGRTMSQLRRQRDEGGRRWLFVGRIAPNKCQHDVIAAFAVFRRAFDAKARLSLVGGPTSPRYLRALQEMAAELGVGDSVDFLESVPFPQLLAYFRSADVFVCLSEHEGFCVPILESMELGLPVVAYEAAAVTDTVGDAGVLLSDKDPLAVACAVQELLSDDARVQQLVGAGRARAATQSLEETSKTLLETIERSLSGGDDLG